MQYSSPHYKVVLTAPNWSLSGVNIRSENMAREMLAAGIDVRILITENNTIRVNLGETLLPLPDDIPIEELPVSHSASWGERWVAMIEYLEGLAPCIYLPNYDWRQMCISPLLSDQVAIIGGVFADSPIYYDHVARLGKYWNGIEAVSGSIDRTLKRAYPEFKDRINLIPVAVQVPENKTEHPRKIGDPLRIIYHGRLTNNEKRIMDIVKIMKSLRRRKIPFQVTIVGTGNDEEEFRAASQKFEKRNQIKFLGMLPPKDALLELSKNDVYLLPSDVEGLPNALLEAMAYGLVPIATDIPSGIPDVIQDGINGFLVPVGNIKAFTRKLKSLYASPELFSKLSGEAFKTMREGEYRVERMVEKQISLYDKVITDILEHRFQRAEGIFDGPVEEVGGISIMPGDLTEDIDFIREYQSNRKQV